MRVFERSIHGGLGAGNIGVVMSRPGVGKTAFLVGVALDDLMRERKVLHVNTKDSAEKVREFYDEVFQDLAESSKLANRNEVHMQVERSRMIHTFRGGSFDMDRLRGALSYMKEHMDFVPSTIIIDEYPEWETAGEDEIRGLKELAGQTGAEMWLSGIVHRDDQDRDERGVPARISRFEELVSVLLRLKPEQDHVRLELIKDHDNKDVADLYIELQPNTLLLSW